MNDAAPEGWKLHHAEAPPARARGDAQADKIVSLANQRYQFGRTPQGEAFAVLRDGPAIAMPLRGSGSLRANLAHAYFVSHGSTPSTSAIADAMNVIEGQANAAKPEAVHIRAAAHAGGVVLDLGDSTGRCVIIDPAGWRMEERSPVLFRRTETLGEMREPQRGGSVQELRELLNVTDQSWPLLLGWIVAALLPSIGHPVLLFSGEMGTGKSTAAGMVVGLIDPGPVPLRPPPRDEQQFVISSLGSMVVAFDNISGIPIWWSDSLCRMVDGTGSILRKLYSDSDVSVLKLRRTMILTGIDLADLRGDFGDRMLLVDLERIEGTNRRGDAELWARFNARAPYILGAILDLLAGVLAHLPDVRLESMTRMADFSRAIAALDEAADVGAFEAYMGQAGRVSDIVIDSDPFAEKLIAMVAPLRGAWVGTAADVLAQIVKPNPLPKGWPATPQAIGGRLKRIAPALRERGFGIVQARESGDDRRRVWTIEPPESMRATADDVFPIDSQPRQQHQHPRTADTGASGDSEEPLPFVPTGDAGEGGSGDE